MFHPEDPLGAPLPMDKLYSSWPTTLTSFRHIIRDSICPNVYWIIDVVSVSEKQAANNFVKNAIAQELPNAVLGYII